MPTPTPQPVHRGRLACALPALLLALAAGAPASGSDSVRTTAAGSREQRIARQLASNPDAQPSLADWTAGLPPFDARYQADGTPTEAAAGSLAKLAELPAWASRQAEARQLIESTPELRIDDDPVFGTPQFVRSTRVFLTDAAPGLAPADVVAGYIHTHAALFEIDALEIPAARIVRDFVTDHNGVTHLTFQQQIGGVDLFGCQVRANVLPDGRLINIASTMLPRPAGEGGGEGGFAAPAHALTAAEAITAAARAVGIELAEVPVPDAEPVGPSQRTVWRTPAGGALRADEPVVTERVYFPMTREDIRAAYTVVIPVPGAGHTYDIIVDAVDGELLSRGNRLVWETTQPVTMRVYTSDGVAPMSPSLPTPSTTQAPVVERELVTINPADVSAFSPNGWINDNNTQTLGNNVDSHLDVDSNNQPDLPRPDGGAARVFDFPIFVNQDPGSYTRASVTQAFYLGNRFHDRMYALGFNEAAGNFQTLNFSGQGAGNDAILIDVQDGRGAASPSYNNANYNGSWTDGTMGRVQLFLFNGPTPDRDSALASDIVYHELTHGMSIRLVGFSSGAVGQLGGMGEGWSDFFGVSLLAEPGDDPDGNYAADCYLSYQLLSPAYTTNYYFGIRRFPYSTNLGRNPLTFADIDAAQYAIPPGVPINPVLNPDPSEVHSVGEVWCSMLMECRALLWRRDGFSANELMMRLVVDGMKLSPAAPTFVQARDAIVQADMVSNAAANRIPLWTGFSKRGLGSGAISPSGGTAGVVESYSVPFVANFNFPDGVPTRLDPGRPTRFRVRITTDELTIAPGTQALVYRVNDGAPAVSPLAATSTPDEYLATIPPLNCLDRLRFTIRIGTDFGDYSSPAGGEYAAKVYTASTAAGADDFEADTGWTVGPDTALVGNWVRVDPVGTASQPESDHSDDPGAMCWVTGQGLAGGAAGDADVDAGATTLTSPAYDLSGAGDAQVSYWRWYSSAGNGQPYADTFRVEVSTDGGAAWTRAETIGPGSTSDPDTNPGWRFAHWKLGDVGLAPAAAVRVRFIADDVGAGSIIEAAIDDFRIERLTCDPADVCLADVNGSGTATVQDVLDFVGAYLSGSLTADFNGADGLTPQDLFDFLAAYFQGCS